jgi:hypothetical protein
VAFGILSDRLEAGDPANGAESFNEFSASTNIIEDVPPMKLGARVNDFAWRKQVKEMRTVDSHTSLWPRTRIDLTTFRSHRQRHHPVAYLPQDYWSDLSTCRSSHSSLHLHLHYSDIGSASARFLRVHRVPPRGQVDGHRVNVGADKTESLALKVFAREWYQSGARWPKMRP